MSDYLARTFMFPYQTPSLDAAINLMSDLEWFGNTEGYLVMVEETKNTRSLKAFAGLLPNVVDRWRAKGIPFAVAIRGATPVVLKALTRANLSLKSAGELPWATLGTGDVDIVRLEDE